MLLGVRTYLKLAARLGFEPRYTPPEGVVLPLDDLAIEPKRIRRAPGGAPLSYTNRGDTQTVSSAYSSAKTSHASSPVSR